MENKEGYVSASEKIDQLNKLAWEIRVADSTRAHELSREAFQLAEEINYVKGKAEGYRTFAFTLIRLSKHQEALAYCDKALPLFESLHDLNGQTSVYEYHGIIQRSYGNYAASLDYLFKALAIRQQTGNKEGESLTSYHLGATYKYLGDFETALTYLLQGLSVAREHDLLMPKSYCLNLIGLIYFEMGDFTNAIEYYQESLESRQKLGDLWGQAGCLDNMGIIHYKLKEYKKALEFCSRALSISNSVDDKKGEGNALVNLGNICKELADYQKANTYYNESLAIRKVIQDKRGQAEVMLFLAELQLKENITEQLRNNVIALLNHALQLGEEIKALDLLAKIHLGFYEACKQFNLHQEALAHIEIYISLFKQIHTDSLNQKIQHLEISHKVENAKNEAEIYRLRNVELAGLYEETNRQKEEIQSTLTELKETQSQLIQREKMASLGELTAGIAHEIQNPLNFVNNFSEVNKEILAEMKDELEKGNIDEAKTLADDVIANEEKINHHGKRADAIVKGMLQHSRSSTGHKEPTNINSLCDEYLRLAFHGLRAKDKMFNATLKTAYDETIGNIHVIPQDIGRALLNLINNAFYAVAEKKIQDTGEYEPTVSVTTIKKNQLVEIIVSDNGNGIPQKIIDKIFQPFFTTKPTGQGTGLGLSLAYDIVKAHSGELKAETKAGEGSMFTISLPEKLPA
ncbi:tetratricopeptide repeat protein [Ferruginibacter paludis]|uniref:tetratricopeptide repeat protein n=1 Tax=Ferruginibacter paludis TaxID=1310417 RepID=UPI0025B38E35|nr:tetratricopeptide repeat protein [Ferruginibacter paludis]MDN3657282.1 tetratricopeptide repeat protein [Ferruginibacter paludis]